MFSWGGKLIDIYVSRVTLRDSVGMVSSELVCPYPPGIPIICPGEELTGEIIDALHNINLSCTTVTGPEDPSLNTIGVIANFI